MRQEVFQHSTPPQGIMHYASSFDVHMQHPVLPHDLTPSPNRTIRWLSDVSDSIHLYWSTWEDPLENATTQ
jgi:hypothetical protein